MVKFYKKEYNLGKELQEETVKTAHELKTKNHDFQHKVRSHF